MLIDMQRRAFCCADDGLCIILAPETAWVGVQVYRFPSLGGQLGLTLGFLF